VLFSRQLYRARFGARTILTRCAGAVIPLVPLLLVTGPIAEVARHLGKMMFGV
jgi:hypothetical protein